MKHFRPNLIALCAGLMAAAEAQTSTGSTAAAAAPLAPTGDAPTSNVTGATPAETAKRAAKNPDNVLDIINGRLPFPLVHMIRFNGLGELNTNDAAKAFGTSVGKVFDIKKGRNFGYIDKDYKPSAEEMAAAKAWCTTAKTKRTEKSLKDAGGKADEILAALEKMTVATPDEVAKRGWTVRTVGVASEPGAAPVAPAAGAAAAPAAEGAQAASTATAKPGAKLF